MQRSSPYSQIDRNAHLRSSETAHDDKLSYGYDMKKRFDSHFMFALAQVMVKGGRYEPPHTLSAGDSLCDMIWSI